MTDPVTACTFALASFLSFMGHHSDPEIYAQDHASLAYLTELSADIADALRPCEGHETEFATIAGLSRAFANRAHLLPQPKTW